MFATDNGKLAGAHMDWVLQWDRQSLNLNTASSLVKELYELEPQVSPAPLPLTSSSSSLHPATFTPLTLLWGDWEKQSHDNQGYIKA